MALWRDTPLWALRILVAELPVVQADALQRAAQAAAFPHLKDGDRRELVRAWRQIARPRGAAPAPPVAPPDPLTEDRAAAAAYFAAMGARVVRVPLREPPHE